MDEFYIGYLPKAPDKTSRFIRTLLFILFLSITSAGILLALHQRNFSTAVFEYGSNKVYTGIYSKNPIPSIKIINQKDSKGNLINITIPLVGYGKHGAQSAIENYENENAVSLNGKMVTFKGDLLYGDQKSLLSLNHDTPILKCDNTELVPDKLIYLCDTILNGEIIDPKCYFGVMKPGQGKIHRECAIRCISGGIPPAFRVLKSTGSYDYFLLLGENGETINQNVLPFVADPVKLKGKLFQWGDWMVIEVGHINRI